VNINRAFMLTPSVSVGLPSHNYEYQGEAVVGRHLRELKLGVDAGQRVNGIRTSFQTRYSYTIVPRVLDIPNNRSNGSVDGTFAFTRRFSGAGVLAWQKTHGGLRMPIDVTDPAHPERLMEYQRLLRDNYLRAGAVISCSHGAWQFSASGLGTARGSNSHDIHAFTLTVGRLFGV